MSNNSETISFLQESGYIVRVSHERPLEGVSVVKDWQGDPIVVQGHFGAPILCNRNTLRSDYEKLQWRPNGGFTRVRIFKGEAILAESYAVCSELDNFSRRMGLTIALGRALKSMKAADAALDAVR